MGTWAALLRLGGATHRHSAVRRPKRLGVGLGSFHLLLELAHDLEKRSKEGKKERK